jgi:LPS-assembly lipoprotein
MPTRRTLLLAAPGLLLAGCGFRLRGSHQFSFNSIQLGFGRRSEIGNEVRRQLFASPGLQVVESEKDAQVVLEILEDSISRTASASTAAGQVREIAVHARLHFRLRTPDGRELLGVTQLGASQAISYNETYALGKESEEAEVLQDLRADLVMQLMRRLAAVKL